MDDPRNGGTVVMTGMGSSAAIGIVLRRAAARSA
jgi:hypothetical protein